MRGARAAACLLLLAAASARAQDTLPPQPLPPLPPPVTAAPLPPAAPAPPAAPPALAWLPRPGGDLVALDKLSSRTTRLSLDDGQSAAFGTLTITLRSCYVRPPDVPEDATAWLDITDSTQGAPSFHGWLVKSDPAVSGLQHPSYDVRLAGCH